MEVQQDRAAIAAFIKQRFTERYVTSLSQEKDRKNGFAIAALACLMIEAIESFRKGWPTSRGCRKKPFDGFFADHSQFASLVPITGEFYKNIRCGLLHQGETTGGWRIRRVGALWQPETQTINSVKLMKGVQSALATYCEQLASEPWTSETWKRLRKKMESVCNNSLG